MSNSKGNQQGLMGFESWKDVRQNLRKPFWQWPRGYKVYTAFLILVTGLRVASWTMEDNRATKAAIRRNMEWEKEQERLAKVAAMRSQNHPQDPK